MLGSHRLPVPGTDTGGHEAGPVCPPRRLPWQGPQPPSPELTHGLVSFIMRSSQSADQGRVRASGLSYQACSFQAADTQGHYLFLPGSLFQDGPLEASSSTGPRPLA